MIENVKTRQIVTLAGLAAAAMVALAIWTNPERRAAAPSGATVMAPAPVATTPAGAPTLDLAIPELDSLPAEALDSILRTLDEPLAKVGADDQPPDESGDRELEQVLAGMEG